MSKYLLVLLLAGCASPQIVKVPIPLPPPQPPVIERPHLPVKDITPEAITLCEGKDIGCGVIVNAWAASLELTWGWAVELETVLEGYRK